MSLITLPPEISCEIVSYLPICDVASLTQTHSIYRSFQAYLYFIDAHTSQKALCHAAGKGEFGIAEASLAAYHSAQISPLSCRDSQGRTPLLLAVQRDHVGIVKLLLKHGFDPNNNCGLSFSLLHQAAKLESDQAIQALLSYGAWSYAKDRDGAAALHLAVMGSNATAIEHLVHASPNVDSSDAVGATALHYAARTGSMEGARTLLSLGADADRPDKFGARPLHQAAKAGFSHIIELLLKYDVNIDAKDCEGNTALHLSAKAGKISAMQVLLSGRASINAKNRTYDTPLICAAGINVPEASQILLDHGADFNITNLEGLTPYSFATASENMKVVDIYQRYGYVPGLFNGVAKQHHRKGQLLSLLMRYAGCLPVSSRVLLLADAEQLGITDLIDQILSTMPLSADALNQGLAIAAKQGNRQAFDVFLRHGASTEVPSNGENMSPAHFAVVENHIDILAALIDSGADISAGQCGLTPLYLAVYCGRHHAAKMLLEHGADVNDNGQCDQTLLHMAVELSDAAMMGMLLDYGADVNRASRSGITPLHSALTSGCPANMVHKLINCGADIETVCPDGKTPLHIAVEGPGNKLVELLATYPINLNAYCRDGYTALHLAAQLGNLEAVSALLLYGADCNALSTCMRTALNFAERRGFSTICSLLRFYTR